MIHVHLNSFHLGSNQLHEGCGPLRNVCPRREGLTLDDRFAVEHGLDILEISIQSSKCAFFIYPRDSAPFGGPRRRGGGNQSGFHNFPGVPLPGSRSTSPQIYDISRHALFDDLLGIHLLSVL